MVILAVLLGLAVLGLVVQIALAHRTTRSQPAELQGEWWTRFESEFRDYAATQAREPR